MGIDINPLIPASNGLQQGFNNQVSNYINSSLLGLSGVLRVDTGVLYGGSTLNHVAAPTVSYSFNNQDLESVGVLRVGSTSTNGLVTIGNSANTAESLASITFKYSAGGTPSPQAGQAYNMVISNYADEQLGIYNATLGKIANFHSDGTFTLGSSDGVGLYDFIAKDIESNGNTYVGKNVIGDSKIELGNSDSTSACKPELNFHYSPGGTPPSTAGQAYNMQFKNILDKRLALKNSTLGTIHLWIGNGNQTLGTTDGVGLYNLTAMDLIADGTFYGTTAILQRDSVQNCHFQVKCNFAGNNAVASFFIEDNGVNTFHTFGTLSNHESRWAVNNGAAYQLYQGTSGKFYPKAASDLGRDINPWGNFYISGAIYGYGATSQIIADESFSINYDNAAGGSETYEIKRNGTVVEQIDTSVSHFFGDIAGGNTSEIEADGTLTFNNDATVWDDYVVALGPNNWKGSSNNPTLTKLADDGAGSQGVYAYVFGDGDEAIITAQMPHRWLEGSRIYPHVHFYCLTDVDPTDNFGIEFEYWWSDIGEDFPTNTTLVSEDTSTGINTQYMHQITNVPSAGIDGTGHTISSVLVCRIKRVAGTSDNYAGGIVFLDWDIHYQIDTVGSRTISAK